MALSGKLDLSKSPIELTVTSDRRNVEVTVATAGETLTLKDRWPARITAPGGYTWTLKTDDGTTAVYTGV